MRQRPLTILLCVVFATALLCGVWHLLLDNRSSSVPEQYTDDAPHPTIIPCGPAADGESRDPNKIENIEGELPRAEIPRVDTSLTDDEEAPPHVCPPDPDPAETLAAVAIAARFPVTEPDADDVAAAAEIMRDDERAQRSTQATTIGLLRDVYLSRLRAAWSRYPVREYRTWNTTQLRDAARAYPPTFIRNKTTVQPWQTDPTPMTVYESPNFSVWVPKSAMQRTESPVTEADAWKVLFLAESFLAWAHLSCGFTVGYQTVASEAYTMLLQQYRIGICIDHPSSWCVRSKAAHCGANIGFMRIKSNAPEFPFIELFKSQLNARLVGHEVFHCMQMALGVDRAGDFSSLQTEATAEAVGNVFDEYVERRPGAYDRRLLVDLKPAARRQDFRKDTTLPSEASHAYWKSWFLARLMSVRSLSIMVHYYRRIRPGQTESHLASLATVSRFASAKDMFVWWCKEAAVVMHNHLTAQPGQHYFLDHFLAPDDAVDIRLDHNAFVFVGAGGGGNSGNEQVSEPWRQLVPNAPSGPPNVQQDITIRVDNAAADKVCIVVVDTSGNQQRITKYDGDRSVTVPLTRNTVIGIVVVDETRAVPNYTCEDPGRSPDAQCDLRPRVHISLSSLSSTLSTWARTSGFGSVRDALVSRCEEISGLLHDRIYNNEHISYYEQRWQNQELRWMTPNSNAWVMILRRNVFTFVTGEPPINPRRTNCGAPVHRGPVEHCNPEAPFYRIDIQNAPADKICIVVAESIQEYKPFAGLNNVWIYSSTPERRVTKYEGQTNVRVRFRYRTVIGVIVTDETYQDTPSRPIAMSVYEELPGN